MSRLVKWGARGIALNDDAKKSIKFAVRANGEVAYTVTDAGLLGAKGEDDTDKAVLKLVDALFMMYTQDILNNKSMAEWHMCASGFDAYAREKLEELDRSIVIDNISIQSIVPDEEYVQKIRDMQQQMVAGKMAAQMQQTEEKVQEPIQSEEQKPLANGMDMKRIITVVVVVIILILGYFMK